MNLAESCSTRRPVRIAVLNSHPIQYFAPLYAYLNAAPDLEVTALYLSDFSIRGGKDAGFGRPVQWNFDLLAGYRSVFLGDAARTREPGGFWSLIAPQVWSELRSGRYDVVWLHGHNYAANLLALMAAKSVNIPVLMRGDTHLGLAHGAIKSLLQQPALSALYRACDRFLAIGSANAAFYRAMGVPEHKIFLVPYCVDNDRFIRSATLTDDQKINTRKQYSVRLDRPSILYAAKFVRGKRPADLLNAVRRLKTERNLAFTAVMAGSGELEQELRAYCVEHALDNVVFTGFVNQLELPALYGASDIFVLPSEQEHWGLSVNEAMCASLPIVVSREIGCVPDLVKDGINGFTLATGDVDGLTRSLRCLIKNEDLRHQQGRASLARIQQWGFSQCLDGIRSALVGLIVDLNTTTGAPTATMSSAVDAVDGR